MPFPNWPTRLAFQKASATDLPFPDGAFTHIWSQATIYHIPDKAQNPPGSLPRPPTRRRARLRRPHQTTAPTSAPTPATFVYDRLLFDTDFSFYSYIDALRETGFKRPGSPRPLRPPGPQLRLPLPNGHLRQSTRNARNASLPSPTPTSKWSPPSATTNWAGPNTSASSKRITNKPTQGAVHGNRASVFGTGDRRVLRR